MVANNALSQTLRDWPRTVAEARAVQERLRHRVSLTDSVRAEPRYLAGTDVGFKERGRVTRAAVVVLDAGTLAPVDSVVVEEPTRFPYVPGYLSFREVPALLQAFDQLRTDVDAVLCDGQGIAHPRRFGLASHLGVLLDKPTVGVAKSRLCGVFAEPGPDKGERVPLTDGDEQIGWVLRSRRNVKPLFVSPGHRVSLATSVALTQRALTRYRLPETTRWSDRIASRRGGWTNQ